MGRPRAEIEHPEQVILESDPYRRLAFTFHTFVPELTASGLDEDVIAKAAASGGRRCPSTSSRSTTTR